MKPGRQAVDETPTPNVSAADFLPSRRTLKTLTKAARDCRGCPLYARATQTVFGEGPTPAALMLVGEQPGDQEDVQGRPFVGPSGQLLEDLLEKAGLARSEVYVTNAVKHFKWEARGKRRLHAKPSARELKACHPWLKVEIEVVRPQTIVCLGATAAQSILGASFRITRERGKLLPHAGAGQILATYHPSAILRAPDHDARLRMRAELVDDLRIAAVSIQPKRR